MSKEFMVWVLIGALAANASIKLSALVPVRELFGFVGTLAVITFMLLVCVLEVEQQEKRLQLRKKQAKIIKKG